MFCFPSAGSSASLYKNWVQPDNSEIEIIPIEIPGRGTHIAEPAASSVSDLIDSFMPVFLEAARSPFILYGHSFGAVVAFQLAWTLQQRGLKTPEKLIVAGRHAPHMEDPSPLNSSIGDSAMVEEIERMGGTPKAVLEHPEMMQFIVNLLRGDLKTHESFVYDGQKIDIPVVAHCGTLDDATWEEIEFWGDVTTARFEMEQFSGDHFFIKNLGSSYLRSLLKVISENDQAMA